MYDEKVIEYATKRAEFKAKQVTEQVPALGEVEDIMQELLLDVLERLPKYNGDRAGMRTFVCRIMNNKVADLFKPHTAACRGGGQTMESLDDSVPGEDGESVPLFCTVDAACIRAHRGIKPRPAHELRDLKMDVAAAVATLPPELQQLCEMLKTKAPSDVIRETGIARSSFYRKIAVIQAVFTRAGLDEYI